MRDWTEIEAVINSASPVPVSDFVMLLELRKALDEASAETLKERMNLEPHLSYSEVWDEFKHEWGIDA